MYMSPEVADRKPYGAASDTYGLGCVLLEMLVRRQVCAPTPNRTRVDDSRLSAPPTSVPRAVRS